MDKNKNIKSKKYESLPSYFLKKIGSKNFMDIEKKLVEYNLKMYPEPTWVQHNELINRYKELGVKVDWAQIKRFEKRKVYISNQEHYLVRTKPAQLVEKANVLYDAKNPDHEGKPLKEIKLYAFEDFEILFEREQLATLEKESYKTRTGRTGIYRDFRKEMPELREVENLSDSYGSFIAWLAIERIKEEAETSFDIETRKKLENFLKKIIPSKKK